MKSRARPRKESLAEEYFQTLNDEESEGHIIGVMIHDREVISQIRKLLNPEDFYRIANQILFRRMLKMEDDYKKVDITTLYDELRRQGELESVGGIVHVHPLADVFIKGERMPGMLPEYARRVKEWKHKREVFKVLFESAKSTNNGKSAHEICESVINSLQHISITAMARDSANPTSWESIEINQTVWLWKLWLAHGLFHIVAAYSGKSKSAFVLWLCKSILVGAPWPDGTPYNDEIGCVLWAEAEAAQALNARRADTWGLPKSKILSPFANPYLDFNLLLTEHQDAFWNVLRRSDVKLAIVDSLSGACGKDENKPEFSQAIKVLAEIAKDTKKPIIGIHHIGKRDRKERTSGREISLEDVRGHSSIVQFARLVWGIDDPLGDDNRRLSVVKSNLDVFPDPIGFKVTDQGLIFGKPPEPLKQEGAREKAADLLLALLRKGPMPAEEVQKEVEDAGLSWPSAKKAKEKLGIVSTRDGQTGKWHWALLHKEGK